MKKLEPTTSFDENLLNPRLFNTTDGFKEIISTTPDKALVPSLSEHIIEDFKTVVTFIKSMELISSDEHVHRLREAKQELVTFYEKWNEGNVARYLAGSNAESIEIAQHFMRTIRLMIGDIK